MVPAELKGQWKNLYPASGSIAFGCQSKYLRQTVIYPDQVLADSPDQVHSNSIKDRLHPFLAPFFCRLHKSLSQKLGSQNHFEGLNLSVG